MIQSRSTAVVLLYGLLMASCAANTRGGSALASSSTTSPSATGALNSTSAPSATVAPSENRDLKLRYGTLKTRTIDPKADGRNAAAVVAGVNAFAIDLYKSVVAIRTDNVVIGPYSVASALGMIYAGARGVTADEMGKVLHNSLPGSAWHAGLNAYDLTIDARLSGSPTTWTSANKVWVQPGLPLRNDYLDLLAGSYGSPLAESDFATDAEGQRKVINGWVKQSTKDRIPELFPKGAIDSSTVMALVNAIALDAPWEFPFDPAATHDAPFTKLDGTTVNVATMYYGEYLPSALTETYQAVEIPYGGGTLSMVVIVPKDFASFESSLTAESLSSLVSGIKEGGIHLSLPKWTARTHKNLNDTLKALGMPSAFESADFSGMVDGGGLSLATVEHEAFISVDEKGTRAAAATGGAMVASHGPTVSVNKPFLYIIRDRGAGTTLFIGRVMDPAEPA